MVKVRLALFGALTLFMLSGIVTSVASASGPFWHVAGNKLLQGETRQIKLQSKGPLVLKSAGINTEIECKNSISEGANIEGSSTKQGQGKGRVTYSSCTVLKPEPGKCTVAEPITTNQLKAYLAEAATQTHYVEVFEPTVGTVFTTLKFALACPAAVRGERGVNGKVAAEIIPTKVEGQEGMIAFPSPIISEVKHEGETVPIQLEAIGFHAVFTGIYAGRLATFPEKFGVFET